MTTSLLVTLALTIPALLAPVAAAAAIPTPDDAGLSRRALAPGFGPNAVTLSPGTRAGWCLGTTEPPANDVYLYLLPCDTTATWYGAFDLVPGNNAGGVRLSGTGFCLDAGIDPHDGGPSKLYTCYPGVSQQTWYYTTDKHLAITGGTQCLDGTAGGCGLGGCAPGTKKCGTSGFQVWDTNPASAAGGPGFRIHPNGDMTKCLTPSVRAFGDGVVLFAGSCIPTGQPFANLQLFDINKNSAQIKAHGTNFCLDAGLPPVENGVVMKMWTCYPGLFQQQWYYADDNHILLAQGSNNCLDLRKEDGSTIQIWDCSGTDVQQIWTTSPPP